MPEPANFPDVLGYISGGVRLDFGVVQAAVAVRPNPAKAGRPMDVTVILQNTTDSALEVLAVLTVPQRDLSGRNGAFIAKVQRLAIGMQACEVGVLTLPLLAQPGTAPGMYKISLQITAKATAGKGNRVRSADGGGAFYMGAMGQRAQQAIESLRGNKYTGGAKRGGLFSGTPTLEGHFNIEEGGLGGVIDRKADYQPLWTRRDLREDPKALMEKHRDALVNYALPALDRTRMLEPLTNRTIARFKESGYELTAIEASLIARVMVRILEYACTGQLSYGRTFNPRPEYEVHTRLGRSNTATRVTGSIPIVKPDATGQFPAARTTGSIPAARTTGSIPAMRTTGSVPMMRSTGGIPIQGGIQPIRLHWLEELLILLEEDERAARFVSKFVPERCFEPLLHDALIFALREVEAATGLDLGTAPEMESFANDWMETLTSGAKMTFADVYLPLVLAGIIIYDEVLLPDENVKVMQAQLQRMLSARDKERTDQNAELFEITREALDKSLRKYGLGLL
ncbi:MAG: hypothetical protein IPK52_07885 [Chloroflexi bacterium]|nr:hypothetical protein [Chloroflexota bacterium]